MIFKVKIVKIKMSGFYKLFQNVLKVQSKKKLQGTWPETTAQIRFWALVDGYWIKAQARHGITPCRFPCETYVCI